MHSILSHTSLLVSYADHPEIDSCDTSYILLLAPSAGGHETACSNPQFVYLAAQSKTESFPLG